MTLYVKPIGEVFALDTETTGLTPFLTEGKIKNGLECPDMPFAISLCNSDGDSAFVRAGVSSKTREAQWQFHTKSLEELKQLTTNKDLLMVCHNSLHDIFMLETINVPVHCQIADTISMSHVFNPSEPTHALKPLAKKYLGIPDDDEEDVAEEVKMRRRQAKKWPEWKLGAVWQEDYWMANRETIEKYAVRDAERCMLLYLFYQNRFDEDAEEEGTLWRVYNREARLFPVLRDIRRRGMDTKPRHVKALRGEFEEHKEEHFQQARKLLRQLHRTFPIRTRDMVLEPRFQSSPWMRDVFCGVLKMQTDKITKSGNPSLDAQQLQSWARRGGSLGSQLAHCCLEWKAATKALEFIDAYQWYAVRKGNRTYIPANFRQSAPRTGRLSSWNPNLQQVAKPGDDNYSQVQGRLRACFGPRKGHVWYLIDYSQMEVWVFGFISQDETMMEALLSGKEFHSEMAKLAFQDRDDYKANPKGWRQRGKIIMFCKLYGGGVRKIGSIIGCSHIEAMDFVRTYDSILPGVKVYMKQLISEAKRNGYIVNAMGRYYPIDPDFAYKVVNYMIQGSCADLMKAAMYRVWVGLKQFGCRLVATIHDELIIEVPMQTHLRMGTGIRDLVTQWMQVDSHRIGLPKGVGLPVDVAVTDTTWINTVPWGKFNGTDKG